MCCAYIGDGAVSFFCAVLTPLEILWWGVVALGVGISNGVN
jgi:hypothetical protein